MGQKQVLRPIAAAGLFALLPAAAGAGGLAIAPALGLAGLFLIRPQTLAERFQSPSIFLILFALFCTWAIASTAWLHAADHRQAWRLLGVFVTGSLFVAGVAADQRTRDVAWAAGAAAALVMAGLLAIEWLGDMPFNRAAQPPGVETWVLQRNPGRGVTVLLTLVWPVIGGLLAGGGRIRFGFAGLAAIVAGVLALQFNMQANIVALALGLGAFALGFALPRFGVMAVSGALAGWLLVVPILAPILARTPGIAEKLPFSWAARVEIWNFASARIVEQPWIGRGLDSARHFDDVLTVQGRQMRAIPLHPHSASLQIWLELGGVGALLAAATLIFGGVAMSRAFATNRPAAAAAAATLACFGFTSNVSYGAWQEWWVASAFIAAALIAAMPTSAKA